MNDEGKIKLNNQAVPKKEGLYIVIKRLIGHQPVNASNQPFIHHTKAEAQKEAERLAQLCPNYEFLVMEAISVSKTTEVKTTKFKV